MSKDIDSEGTLIHYWVFNTLRSRQNIHHFADKILKCIFLTKMYEFCLRFHWSLLYGLNQQNSSIGSDNGLALARWQAIVWTNDG